MSCRIRSTDGGFGQVVDDLMRVFPRSAASPQIALGQQIPTPRSVVSVVVDMARRIQGCRLEYEDPREAATVLAENLD